MFRFVLAALLAACMVPAQAQTAKAAREQVEASMLVTGTLDIGADGSVLSYLIDKREKIPAYVTDIIDRAAMTWRFVPHEVEGQPVIARARMTLRMHARPLGGGDFEVSIANATFGERDPDRSDFVSSTDLKPPRYPFDTLRRGGQGTVYVVLQVDRNGQVADAVIEQVNLRNVANARTLDDVRKRFADAVLRAAKTWTFVTPTTGKHVDDPFWSLRVPVEFTYEEASENYGKWLGYVPGPRQPVPWIRHGDNGGNDALAAGALHQVGTGFKLLTPLVPDA